MIRIALIDFRTELTIGEGLAIKDDVLIHVTAAYDLDFSDADSYIDATTDMDSTGTYYVVLQYTYTRSLPTPAAYFKIIQDVANLYTPFASQYIFLAAINIVFDGIYKIGTGTTDVATYDPAYPDTILRPTLINRDLDEYILDGGVIP